jgi:hypothetical protein
LGLVNSARLIEWHTEKQMHYAVVGFQNHRRAAIRGRRIDYLPIRPAGVVNRLLRVAPAG